MRLNPVLEGLRHLPVRPPRRGQASACAPRESTSSTSGSASRARRRPPSSAARWPTRSSRCRPTRWPQGCPSCATAIAAWVAAPLRRGAGPRHADRADARAPRRRSSTWRRSSGRAAVAVTTPGLSRRRARRAVRRARGRRAAAAPPSAGSCPTSTRCPGGLALLWLNYPNNPTAATAAAAFYERAAALAREHDFVLASDEAYSELYFGRRGAGVRACSSPTCANVARVQHALQALVDARLPLGLRGRRPGAGRRAQALPPERRRRAAGVRPARRGRRVGRRGARRRGPRDATAPSATSSCPPCEAAGLRHGGRRRDVLPVAARRATTRRCARRCSSAGVVVAPGAYFGAAGAGYVRVALVPTLGRVRGGRPASPQSLACSAALSPPQLPAARQDLDGAGDASCGGTAGPAGPTARGP